MIATLNALFAEIVPVVEAYGGHVDKFLGDGLLAVFGAPEVQPDHADRAVDAARMIVDTVTMGASGLRVSAGVNSGRVVAGPLGGAGRLNFSVIGDAVNVAARVEAATRATGDDVLLTRDTRAMLVRPQRLVSRGELPLKGKSEPVELFAQVPGSPSPRWLRCEERRRRATKPPRWSQVRPRCRYPSRSRAPRRRRPRISSRSRSATGSGRGRRTSRPRRPPTRRSGP